MHDHSATTDGASIDNIRRFVCQGLVRTLAVVEGEVLGQTKQQLAHRSVALQIHVFMLDAAPQPLDEDVVEGAPPAIHADGDAFAFQHVGEGGAGELRALVAVEDFRCAVVA